MPLKGGHSRETVSDNIAKLMREYERDGSIGTSKPKSKRAAQQQAVAIALSNAREEWRREHPRGRFPSHLRRGSSSNPRQTPREFVAVTRGGRTVNVNAGSTREAGQLASQQTGEDVLAVDPASEVMQEQRMARQKNPGDKDTLHLARGGFGTVQIKSGSPSAKNFSAMQRLEDAGARSFGTWRNLTQAKKDAKLAGYDRIEFDENPGGQRSSIRVIDLKQANSRKSNPAPTVAQVIWSQIEIGVKMSLGARDATDWGGRDYPTMSRTLKAHLVVRVRIRPRTDHRVLIYLNGRDLYDIHVVRFGRGALFATPEIVATREDVGVENLNETLLGLEGEVGRMRRNPKANPTTVRAQCVNPSCRRALNIQNPDGSKFACPACGHQQRTKMTENPGRSSGSSGWTKLSDDTYFRRANFPGNKSDWWVIHNVLPGMEGSKHWLLRTLGSSEAVLKYAQNERAEKAKHHYFERFASVRAAKEAARKEEQRAFKAAGMSNPIPIHAEKKTQPAGAFRTGSGGTPSHVEDAGVSPKPEGWPAFVKDEGVRPRQNPGNDLYDIQIDDAPGNPKKWTVTLPDRSKIHGLWNTTNHNVIDLDSNHLGTASREAELERLLLGIAERRYGSANPGRRRSIRLMWNLPFPGMSQDVEINTKGDMVHVRRGGAYGLGEKATPNKSGRRTKTLEKAGDRRGMRETVRNFADNGYRTYESGPGADFIRNELGLKPSVLNKRAEEAFTKRKSNPKHGRKRRKRVKGIVQNPGGGLMCPVDNTVVSNSSAPGSYDCGNCGAEVTRSA